MITTARDYIAFIDEAGEAFIYTDHAVPLVLPSPARMIRAADKTLYVLTDDDELYVFHDLVASQHSSEWSIDIKLVTVLADKTYCIVTNDDDLFFSFNRNVFYVGNLALMYQKDTHVAILEVELRDRLNIKTAKDVYNKSDIYVVFEDNDLIIKSSKPMPQGSGVKNNDDYTIIGTVISQYRIHSFKFLMNPILRVVTHVEEPGTIFILTTRSLYRFSVEWALPAIGRFPQKIFGDAGITNVVTGGDLPYIIGKHGELKLNGFVIVGIPEPLLALQLDSSRIVPDEGGHYLALGESGKLYRIKLQDRNIRIISPLEI